MLGGGVLEGGGGEGVSRDMGGVCVWGGGGGGRGGGVGRARDKVLGNGYQGMCRVGW